jgi:hypothetical protein
LQGFRGFRVAGFQGCRSQSFRVAGFQSLRVPESLSERRPTLEALRPCDSETPRPLKPCDPLKRLDAIASGGFGAIEVSVGAREGDGRIFFSAKFRNACGNGDAARFGNCEVLDVLSHAFGEDARAAEAHFREQHQELFAAPPHREVRSALRDGQDLGDPLQDEIANGVPTFIVDALEAVDIEKNQAQRGAAAASASDFTGERLLAAAPVRQAGDLIRQRETR